MVGGDYMTDWRKELADQIRAAADSIYKEADRLADQPDFMTADSFEIDIEFKPGTFPFYTVRHEHFVPKAGRNK